MNEPRLRLGELLVESGIISPEQLRTALALQRERQLRLGTILLQEGFVSENQLIQALSRHLSIPWVSLWRIDVPMEIVQMVPVNVAEEFFLFPIYVRVEKSGERALYVAMNDPLDQDALRFVSAASGLPVKPMLAAPSDIAAAIRYYYYGEEAPESEPPPEVAPAAQAAAQSAETPVDLSDEVEELAEPDAPPEGAQAPGDADATAGAAEEAPSASEEREEMRPPAPEDTAPPSPSAPAGPSQPASDPAGADAEPPPVFTSKQEARREAERRIFGVGRRRTTGPFTLTLLDGTTISFGPAKTTSGSAPPSAPELSKDDFLAGLKAMAQGTPVDGFLPSDHWAPYAAALIHLLLDRGLISYAEFVELVSHYSGRSSS